MLKSRFLESATLGMTNFQKTEHIQENKMQDKQSSIKKKIPIILDTDIGTDIDDTWAIAFMLNSPELDVKLITTVSDKTEERARIVAKLLKIANRTDIPVGIGQEHRDTLAPIRQLPWIEDFDLKSYDGVVYKDGAGAIINTIEKSEEPITVIGIGPLTNIGEALTRKPEIARNAIFVGMQGSVYRGYSGTPGGVPEYNVICDVEASKKVFTANWKDMIITPLDTCGLIKLQGKDYKTVYNCANPLIKALIDNYRIWLNGESAENESTVLFDTVAIYLAFSYDLLVMKREGIYITDDGRTALNPNAKQVNCAIDWKDLDTFKKLLAERLVEKDVSKLL